MSNETQRYVQRPNLDQSYMWWIYRKDTGQRVGWVTKFNVGWLPFCFDCEPWVQPWGESLAQARQRMITHYEATHVGGEGGSADEQ